MDNTVIKLELKMKDWNKFIKGSRNFLKNYIIDNKLESCVLGISGGIDSTISACIASPVCKKLNIPLIGRSLPTISNHDIEIDVADLVGNAFCDNYAKKSIEADYIQLLGSLEREGEVSKLQRGNIKARLRMMYLRNLASIHRGVVLDNDNFTEWNLGFWTVGGDSPMDINLGLHYLWKTEIYELADYLADEIYEKVEDTNVYSKQYQAIIESIRMTPTDGNGVSNSDCEQFGLDNYEQVDDVLITMYYPEEKYFNPSEARDQYVRLIDDYNEQGVDNVITLHQNTEYKRKELPIKPTREELGL